MNGKAKQLPGAKWKNARRLRHWFRALLEVLDDILAVSLAGFSAAGSGLAAARATKAHGRRL